MISAALASGVSKSEIHSMVATTTPPAPTNGHSSDKVRKDDQGLPIYAELPSGMIDLPAAAKKHGGTVAPWDSTATGLAVVVYNLEAGSEHLSVVAAIWWCRRRICWPINRWQLLEKVVPVKVNN